MSIDSQYITLTSKRGRHKHKKLYPAVSGRILRLLLTKAEKQYGTRKLNEDYHD